MIRTWSLLLRAAKRASALIPDRPETQPLKEHTFIFHPVESGEMFGTFSFLTKSNKNVYSFQSLHYWECKIAIDRVRVGVAGGGSGLKQMA